MPPDTKTYLGQEGEHKAFAFLRQPQRTGMAAVLPAAGANEVFLFSLGVGSRSMVGTDYDIERGAPREAGMEAEGLECLLLSSRLTDVPSDFLHHQG